MKNFNKEDNLIEIIFEDDFIILINKKNGLLSHCNQIENTNSNASCFTAGVVSAGVASCFLCNFL